MPRLLLHFALVLSLIFNGISAPWAMARMGHGDHGAHDARAIHHDAAQSAPHDSTAHHRHHDHLDVGAPTEADPSPDPLADGSCCDGSSCQCGCVLPPVLALRMTGVLPVSIGMPAFVAAESHPVLRRTSPPLRPPAA
jgi:hypothetical protein